MVRAMNRLRPVLAIKDGRIAAVGQLSGRGQEEINGKGKIVTPGFVDIHTRCWLDPGATPGRTTVAPSSGHGITSVAVGNCGVGFRPLPSGRGAARLIRLMEGADHSRIRDALRCPMEQGDFPEYSRTSWPNGIAVADDTDTVAHAALRGHGAGQRGSRSRAPRPRPTKLGRRASWAGSGEGQRHGITAHRARCSAAPSDGTSIPTLSAHAELMMLAMAPKSEAAASPVLQRLLGPPERALLGL